MSAAGRPCKVVAGALLAAAVLVTAPDAPRAQERTGGNATTRILEHPSEAMATAQRQRARQHRRLQRLGMERRQAHARMPDTMYASTPDPSPPHPFLPDVDAEPIPAPSAAGDSVRSATRLGYRVGLFPSASRWRGERGYQGFVRVINRSDEAGAVRIDAWDDSGVHADAVTLAIGARETKHFNSGDLETGAEDKGLSGGIGAGDGDWRLELASALDLEVLTYIRTRDGFLTAMHDVAPSGESGHRVVTFNPGKNDEQVSRLRVVNPGVERTEVRIEGVDDAGASSGDAVELTLAAGASRMLTAKELESGDAEGLSGALGKGKGKWRLEVTADRPVEVMSLLSSPTGHLTNLSTVPANADAGGAGTTHAVGLFPSASDAQGRQGFVRVVNRSGEAGAVRIDAWDDSGVQADAVTLAIGANETKHFNSEDLEGGNPDKGLEGATGSGEGDWRLALTSGLDIEVLAYIRTEDGFLTAMHDVAPSGGAGHRVVTFNPGKNADQVSWLRLVNPGDGPAEVSIEGVDDKGASPGGAVELSLGAEASRTLSAEELESGEAEGLSGALGTGGGKWRLSVTADRPVQVMSLLSSPTGHLTNLSTVPRKVALGAGETAAEVFREHISKPIVQGKCIACHVAGGVSGHTRLVFVRDADPDHAALNLQEFEDLLNEVDDGAIYILNKIQGVGHGGGVQVPAGSDEFADMERFLELLGEAVTPVTLTPQTLFDTVRMASLRKTLRRAALIFAGRIPTDEEYAAAQGGGEEARATIRGLMTGPEFHEFLIRAANDRLLTDREQYVLSNEGFLVAYANEFVRRKEVVHATGDDWYFHGWDERVQYGARRAPLELIAHVVENDRPYTEILTADYIMANPMAATAYGASTHFDDVEDPHEFKPSRIASYYRHTDGYEAEDDPVIDAYRVIDPGPLRTDYPQAGILNTKVFLQRYPTTATNRNRARSRWTYYHFLGFDIEKSASRTTDPEALTDTNNPTMLNPACTVCHRVLDPVAGAFQNYDDAGWYKSNWHGMDSLDEYYKRGGYLAPLAIQADSWEDRATLSWSVRLATGANTLRVFYTNDFYDDDTGVDGTIYLDRLDVRDSRGAVIISREFEHLESPYIDGGGCGGARHHSNSGPNDHVAIWNGALDCPILVDVDVESAGKYSIEAVAWADRHEQYGEGGFAEMSVAVVNEDHIYQEGDTWYRDMRAPGFGGEVAPNSDNSVQWLAQQIVADERFAEATVKFWWPAIMGSEVAEPPEEEEDADFEGRLLAANAQGAEVARLAFGFQRGFRGGSEYHLKDLLVEMVISEWFRAEAVEDEDPIRRVALRDAGARRLLTPEELARKTAALTGFQWGRRINAACNPVCDRMSSSLTDQYRLVYGGIDSDGITERARDITSVVAGVAKLHASWASCPIIVRELYLLPESERRLFAGIDQFVAPPQGANVVRNKLVELYDKLLGVQMTPYSPDVESAYRLFLEEVERARASGRDPFYWVHQNWSCFWGWVNDHLYFDGILDDVVVARKYEDGIPYYDFDHDRVGDFMEGVDLSDPHQTAHAWVMVLTYLLADYRFLYL